MSRETELIVNGEPVALNPFLETLICNVVTSLVGSFKDTDSNGEIEIRIAEEGDIKE